VDSVLPADPAAPSSAARGYGLLRGRVHHPIQVCPRLSYGSVSGGQPRSYPCVSRGVTSASLSPVTLDLSSLVAAVEAEARDIDLSGVVLHRGCQNVVLETRDGWILRFPRAPRDFEREVATLSRLADRLPVRIPRVEWTGRHRRFTAYRKLDGHSFDLAAYQRASGVQRDVLAGSLANFLAAMHHCLTIEEIDDLQIPDHEPGDGDPTRAFAALPPDLRRFADDLITEADDLREERRRTAEHTVILHNDFHFWNLVLSAPVGEVTGVWDFSSVARGDPSDDLRYIPHQPCDLLDRLARHYEQKTGDRIDMRAATVANRIEVVFDAIECHRTTELHRSVRAWQHADSQRAGQG
jgi:aminoglycoside phosphotransferase (APT) family kinase protein